MIEVEGLAKVYVADDGGAVEAVREVSFNAAAGTIFGLLGPNGAGKTTTLRIIATMLKPTRGQVRVDGIDALDDPLAVRRRIGFVSASTALYERLTPRETLRYFGQLAGMGEAAIEARIAELVTTLDMRAFVDRVCGVLSSGQKQKTSIARALIHDPPVLIFDEPTATLDVLVARALRERIADMKAASRTIVLSTHDMAEAERLCDEIAIIHRGRVRAECAPQELLERTNQPNLEDAFFHLIDWDAASSAEELEAYDG